MTTEDFYEVEQINRKKVINSALSSIIK